MYKYNHLASLTGGVLIDLSTSKINGNCLNRDTGRKVEDPELLEAIRLTIINNLLEYHPVTAFIYLFSEGL